MRLQLSSELLTYPSNRAAPAIHKYEIRQRTPPLVYLFRWRKQARPKGERTILDQYIAAKDTGGARTLGRLAMCNATPVSGSAKSATTSELMPVG